MKIAIDISQIIYQTGVSTYTKELVKELLTIDKQNEYILFGGSLRRMGELQGFADTLSGNFTTRFLPLPPTAADMLWNALHVGNIENFVGKVDVFHTSDWAQAPTKAFCVTTMHDLTPLIMPEQTNKKVVSAHKSRFKWVKKDTDVIITPSKSAKNDLINLGIQENKIAVIPEAPASRYVPQSKEKIAKLKAKYGITGTFFLAVGNAPRKNIASSVQAFLKSQGDTKVDKLVVVGRGDDSYLHSDNVIFTGHVHDEDLPIFYSGAEALIYASFYEGFGLPILEAYACKCPVVASNTSSLPEVGGEAAVYVNPKSINSIALGMIKVTKVREGLIKMGSERVKNFSWEKTAKETLKVYNQAV